MDIKIITSPIPLSVVAEAAQNTFGEMVKAVADLELGIFAMGGEWHSDSEAALLEAGSEQKDLWGFNIYPDKEPSDRLVFVSLINIRPSQGNRKMEIESSEIREKITNIVNNLIQA